MSITAKPYGKDQHGTPVTEYTLTNTKGAYVSILDYGGIITRIAVPDRDGKLDDINLGYADALCYTADSGSMVRTELSSKLAFCRKAVCTSVTP